MTASWNKRRRNGRRTIPRSVCVYGPEYRCHLPEKSIHRHINLQSHITNYCASRFSDCYWNQFGVYSQQLSVLTSVLLYARILGLFDEIYLENVELPNDLKGNERDCFYGTISDLV